MPEPWDSVLLVDPSPVVRELATLHLRLRGHEALAVATLDEARKQIEQESPGYLVLPAEDGGLDLLRELSQLTEARPHVVVTTRAPSLEGETAASLGGAIAYLVKPFKLSDLDRAMGTWPLVFDASVAPRAKRRGLARALLCDPRSNDAMIEVEVHDLSRSGAFLLSRAPIEPGTPLRMILCLANGWHPLEATVVRVQQPDWDHPGGVGVRFAAVSAGAVRAIDQVVAADPRNRKPA